MYFPHPDIFQDTSRTLSFIIACFFSLRIYESLSFDWCTDNEEFIHKMIKKNFEIERYERTRTINVMILFNSIMEITSTINPYPANVENRVSS